MDVLRKEITGIYDAQRLDEEQLNPAVVERSCLAVECASAIDNDCRVLTDAAADRCWIYGGAFARLLGIGNNAEEFNSSDEDVIYCRIHPEDLVEKRMLEYEFFKFADSLPVTEKLQHMATCRFRIKTRDDRYVMVVNSTRIMQLSPNGKIWLILCIYNLDSNQEAAPDISPAIVNMETGSIAHLELNERRSRILSRREKEILNLIKVGKPSKQIADILGISIHTVNRHRQNILEKLSVGNSMEALLAASEMKLL